MNSKIKSLILSGLISALYISIAFIVFINTSHEEMDCAFIDFLIFPALIASAFRFGSGELSFFIVLFVELIIATIVLYSLAYLLSKNVKRFIKQKGNK